MKYILTLALLLSSVHGVVAQDSAESSRSENQTLAELAQAADFIGVVQVQTIDYEMQRSLPSEGYALLDTLIVYRHPGEAWQEPHFIQVVEEGFAENACYYPERWNEGRRFLVFLQKHEKEGYEGVKPYCMLPVLITDKLRYVLRYPIPGVALADKTVVHEVTFNDPDAYVEPGVDIPYSRARAFADKGFLEQTEDNRQVFTRGIPLSDVRRLMFPNQNAADSE